MNAPDRYADATGRLCELLPPGDERDTFLHLVRVGIPFARAHIGKRPEYLRQFITSLVAKMPEPITFNALLDELALEAARRELHGTTASPIEKVDRVWRLLTYHCPKKGRVQIQFESLQNTFTKAKSSLPLTDD